jgi:hypothetical protein
MRRGAAHRPGSASSIAVPPGQLATHSANRPKRRPSVSW